MAVFPLPERFQVALFKTECLWSFSYRNRLSRAIYVVRSEFRLTVSQSADEVSGKDNLTIKCYYCVVDPGRLSIPRRGNPTTGSDTGRFCAVRGNAIMSKQAIITPSRDSPDQP